MQKLFYIIFVAAAFLGIAVYAEAKGASLSIYPQTGVFTEGNTFNVYVFLNTGENNVNVIRADLKFDPSKLQVVAPTEGISSVSEWFFPPSFSNTTGVITFQGGFAEGGVKTSEGLVSVIVFKAVSRGETEIFFLESSKVLLSDEIGTDVLSSVNRGTYNIIPSPPKGPTVFSETHPDQNKWYKNSSPSFSWQRILWADGYSYIINDDPLGEPDNIINTEETSVSFEEVEEGVQYFHLKAKKAGVWGGTSHFKIMIDKTPPAEFKPYLEPFSLTSDAHLLIYFSTNDMLSGIDHYQVRAADYADSKNVIWSGWIQQESPFDLSKASGGAFSVLVRAFDKAGNFQEEKIEVRILSKNILIVTGGIQFRGLFLSWWFMIFLIAVVALSIYLIIRRIRKKSHLTTVDIEKEIKEAEKEIEDVRIAKEKLGKMKNLEQKGSQEWQRLKRSLGRIKKKKNHKDE